MSNLQFIIDGLIESFEEKKIQNSSKYEKLMNLFVHRLKWII